jgi:hypothetical protein
MSATCSECGEYLICKVCGETEMSQYITDGHPFQPKPCDCQKQEKEEL